MAPRLPAGAHLLSLVPGMPAWFSIGRSLTDAVGRSMRRAGFGPQLLDPDRLVWCARRITGLSSLGVVAHPDGLARACASLQHEAGLGTVGRMVVLHALIRSVSNRLRYVEALARVPQRFEVPLRGPIFVVGLPRSGTTLLHRLLCAAPGARGVPIWEATRPIAAMRDRRRGSAAWLIGLLRAAAPDAMTKHSFELDAPEEAINLFETSVGWNPFLWRIAACHSYVQWMLRQDARQPYACFVDLLRWIAAPTPDQRLVLKTPDHLGHLDLLHALLPRAVFVRTHRDPARCVVSYASLSATMHGVSVGRVDRPALGRTSLDIWSTHAARAARSSVPVIDVSFEGLVADPLATVERIHADAGLPWTHHVRDAVSAEIRRRPAGRYGAHVYAAEDYGLTDDLIRARCALATTTNQD